MLIPKMLSSSSFRAPMVHLSASSFAAVPLSSSLACPISSTLRQSYSFLLMKKQFPRNAFLRNLRPEPRVYVARASANDAVPSSHRKLMLINSTVTIILAVANRVLYKLALVPMKNYPFFLAQFTTFGYVVIYFSILYFRYKSGIISKEMLGVPKWRFVAIGALEALGVASGMASAAMLVGPFIPILNQSFLVWQLIFAAVILGRSYTLNQIIGCFLVATGVVVAVASGSNRGPLLSSTDYIWPTVMVASAAFQAAASILKEFVFIDASKRLKEKSLDVFVVNSFGSGFQALFVLFLSPLLSNMKGIPFTQLPEYLRSGAGCFFNIGASIPGCEGAPLLPLLYITMNLAFNISVLHLVKISSALVASLAVALSVPLSVFVLSLPLPYLPEGADLSPNFVFGSVILVSGLVFYNISRNRPKLKTN